VQEPRPPIWIGGGYPNPRAVERALRWDGSCMYRRAGGPLRAEDVRALVERAGERVWDVAVGGWPRSEDAEADREWRCSVAAEGATWWVEWAEPASRERMTALVAGGPLRTD
jgi:hypothetical protein